MNEHELRRLMYTAQLPDKGTFVIRYPRGRGSLQDWKCPLEEVKVGTGRKLRDGDDVAILSIGPCGNDAAKAIDEITKEAQYNNCKPRSIAHYDMRFLKPLDENLLHEIGKKFKRIVTLEDGVRNGGLGSAVLEWMEDHGYYPEIIRLGLPDKFVEQGTVDELKKICGIDVSGIKKALL